MLALGQWHNITSILGFWSSFPGPCLSATVAPLLAKTWLSQSTRCSKNKVHFVLSARKRSVGKLCCFSSCQFINKPKVLFRFIFLVVSSDARKTITSSQLLYKSSNALNTIGSYASTTFRSVQMPLKLSAQIHRKLSDPSKTIRLVEMH